MSVDWRHRRSVKPAVVFNPPTKDGIEEPREILQFTVSLVADSELPRSDPHGRERFPANCGREANKQNICRSIYLI